MYAQIQIHLSPFIWQWMQTALPLKNYINLQVAPKILLIVLCQQILLKIVLCIYGTILKIYQHMKKIFVLLVYQTIILLIIQLLR
jgi:hypothetical protein